MRKKFLRAKNYIFFGLFSLGGLFALIILKPDIILITKFKLNTSYRLKKYIHHPINNLYDSYRLQIEEKEAWNYRKRKISSAWHNLIKEVIPARKFLYYYASKKVDRNGLPGGYIDYIDSNTILGTNGKGEMFSLDLDAKKLKPIRSNLHNIYNKQNYKGKIIKDLRGRFGVRDLLIDRKDKSVYASIFVDVDRNACYGMAIFKANLNLLNNKNFDKLDFKEYYKTKACNSDFNGHASGGRLKKLNDNLLFTVGSLDYTKTKQIGAQIGAKRLENLNDEAGKVISIDKDGNPSILSLGHRNQQGMTIVGNDIITTEHGPKGGDELNLIKKNQHYGWPYFSYGFEYNNKSKYRTSHKGKYKKPIYYFTPSIGISELVYYEGEEFSYWKNKLIVTSLKMRSIYIMDYDKKNQSIISAEKIYLGHRLRDIIILPNGKIVLITDDQNIIYLYQSGLKKYIEEGSKKIPLPNN